mmetsp:Transcript_2708/g.5934  ORF Transcript_2708/g.5934 Transcript_2708/m.5934 type:complete len:321 (+) Transcript_2708:1760-2722(+)
MLSHRIHCMRMMCMSIHMCIRMSLRRPCRLHPRRLGRLPLLLLLIVLNQPKRALQLGHQALQSRHAHAGHVNVTPARLIGLHLRQLGMQPAEIIVDLAMELVALGVGEGSVRQQLGGGLRLGSLGLLLRGLAVAVVLAFLPPLLGLGRGCGILGRVLGGPRGASDLAVGIALHRGRGVGIPRDPILLGGEGDESHAVGAKAVLVQILDNGIEDRGVVGVIGDPSEGVFLAMRFGIGFGGVEDAAGMRVAFGRVVDVGAEGQGGFVDAFEERGFLLPFGGSGRRSARLGVGGGSSVATATGLFFHFHRGLGSGVASVGIGH